MPNSEKTIPTPDTNKKKFVAGTEAKGKASQSHKNLKGKQKIILVAIAGVALAIGLALVINWSPESVKRSRAQIGQVESLTGSDTVYWISASDSGYKYHLYEDCQHLFGQEITSGKIGDALEQNEIQELCRTCEQRAEREQGIEEVAPEIE